MSRGTISKKAIINLLVAVPLLAACGPGAAAAVSDHAATPHTCTPRVQCARAGSADPASTECAPAIPAVSGVVTWPDGQPARNAVIDIYPNGYPFAGHNGGEIRGSTDDQGKYSLTRCGCAALGMTYHLDYSRNSGNFCNIIIMHADDGAFTTAAAENDVVNWKMVDMPIPIPQAAVGPGRRRGGGRVGDGLSPSQSHLTDILNSSRQL